jgi:hypothetical protein
MPVLISVEDLISQSMELFAECPPWLVAAQPRSLPSRKANGAEGEGRAGAVAIAVLASSVTAGVLVASAVVAALR